MAERAPATAMNGDLMPWHAEVMHQLLDAALSKKIPHAVLLSAPQGTGKTNSVRWLAAALLCARGERAGSCGECNACKLSSAGSHGDLRWVEPEEGKRAIGIDPVRSAAGFLQQTAGYGERKVLVLAPAEAMTTNAANALLKTLEEPPGDAIILLVSDRPDDLPATVRSRCQISVLPQPSGKQCVNWLSARSGCSEDDCRRAVKFAHSRPLAALKLLETDALDEWQALSDQCANLIAGRQSPNATAEALLAWEFDTALTLVVSVVEDAVRSSIFENPIGSQRALASRDAILEWLSAHRRGVNVSRDLVLRECCQMLYKSLA